MNTKDTEDIKILQKHHQQTEFLGQKYSIAPVRYTYIASKR